VFRGSLYLGDTSLYIPVPARTVEIAVENRGLFADAASR
jgi:hypothetical protein